MKAENLVGKPLTRIEDPALLQGIGKYLDDINFEGQLWMHAVRSPYAHAKITYIDASNAAALEGVVAIYSAKDVGAFLQPAPVTKPPGVNVIGIASPAIAGDRVMYVGETVAVVIATSKMVAEDAVAQVDISYEPIAPIMDPKASLEAKQPMHTALESNVVLSSFQESDNFRQMMEKADVVVEAELALPRLVASPIEPRGCIASYDSANDSVTIWASSQDPHRPQSQLAHMLNMDQDKIRVIVPEVGGAFGSKGGAPGEYALACIASKILGAPIKWIEDRSENFIASYQGRGISAKLRLALSHDGKFLAIEADLLADLGAYFFTSTPVSSHTTSSLMTGVYAFPAAKVTLNGVATNKVPTGPYRGAGRPEACYFVESIVDIAAQRLEIDPVELRLRNIVNKDAFPYESALGLTYDSGDYATSLKMLKEILEDGKEFSETPEGWVAGRGIAMYIERAGSGLWESGGVEILGDGTVLAKSGSSAHGQGHKTSLAQVVADELGVEIEKIHIRQGDSADGPGVGTFGSRSMTIGGEALLVASRQVKSKAREWASNHFEASSEDLIWENGRIFVQGSPEVGLTIFEIAKLAIEQDPNFELSAHLRSELPGTVFPYGSYGADVEVDQVTGRVKLRRLVAVDDAGTIVNPLLAEGQVVGSSLQGIASALLEEMVYDDNGQPLTNSFLEYAIPTSAETDFVSENVFLSTPTPYTSLGAKGLGESGTIGALGAVANAVNNALANAGVKRRLEPPFSSEKVWMAISGLGQC